MKVLLTGSKGMLGQDLSPVLMDEGFDVVETDVDSLDIINFENVKEVLHFEKPDIVIHCAAYTNVDKAQNELDIARLINSKGSENIACVADEIDATVVYISTDYVFDGTKKAPYLPEDKPNPINNYGLTKYEGELAIQKYCKKYYITRTSWLYGHNGKNFVETMISLAKNSELKVVDDQIGCPTWTMELAAGIVKLLKNNCKYGIYHICGSGATSWYGFAKEIFKQMNLSINIQPCLTQDFPRPAKRPCYSVMENNKICRNWKLALRDYINLRFDDDKEE